MTDSFVQLVVEFLSTPSARRATNTAAYSLTTCSISIHALREEGDIYSIPGIERI